MCDLGAPTVQRNADRVRASAVVLSVTHDRMADARKLHPDLMFAACFEFDFHHPLVTEVAKGSVPQCRHEGIFLGCVCDAHSHRIFILQKPMSQRAFSRKVRAVNNREVSLGRWCLGPLSVGLGNGLRIARELGAQSRCRLGGACQHDHATGHAIQATYDSDVGIARFVELVFEVLPGPCVQRQPFGAHRRHSRRFVDD